MRMGKSKSKRMEFAPAFCSGDTHPNMRDAKPNASMKKTGSNVARAAMVILSISRDTINGKG